LKFPSETLSNEQLILPATELRRGHLLLSLLTALWLPTTISGVGHPRVEDDIMVTGTVKFFNAQKGFGFITPDTGGKDIFVHISAVERAGMTNLNDGQKVSFEVENGRDGRASAEKLQAA